MIHRSKYVVMSVFCGLLLAVAIAAQTTTFTYQGSLNNGANPANGTYDFEFRLFNVLAGGIQQGSTLTVSNITVANGIFSVPLDFGSQFPGASRFLEIRVRATGGGAFTALAPRQSANSSPYSIKSLTSETATTATNATQLGGVAANQFVVTTDPRMTDARSPTAGSANYLQNTTSPQATSNFNITGNGTAAGTLSAGAVNTATQYNIGGNRILSNAGFSNTFVGIDAGPVNTGSNNSFVGNGAGEANTTGFSNAFFGRGAGTANTTGNANAFFGSNAGSTNSTGGFNAFFGTGTGGDNTTGGYNSFFGTGAGGNNTTGGYNSFFGTSSGDINSTGASNGFFGYSAGSSNTTGSSNAFFGQYAGDNNTTGSNNTIIGKDADVSSEDLSYATAIGSAAIVSTSNTVALGRTTDTVSAPGTMIVGNSTVKRGEVNFYSNSGNFDLYMQGAGTTVGVNIGTSGGAGAGNPSFFISHYDGTNYADRLVITPTGRVRVLALGTAGATALCHNAASELATCSSSMRYKKNIGQFSQGLSFVNKLRPISFDWKDGGMSDVGFGAEEIAKIDDRFVTYNNKGQVEGVKYDRLSVAFVNAFREQQAQIESQQKQIDEQKADISALKALFCEQDAAAAICREK